MCLGFLQGAAGYSLSGLFGDKSKNRLMDCILSGILVFVMSFFLSWGMAVVLGNLVFIIAGHLLKENGYVSIMTSLYVLELEIVFIPLSKIVNYYAFGWEYVLCVLVCLFLLVFYNLYHTNRIDKQWLQQFSLFYSKASYALICMIGVGILLNVGISFMESSIYASVMGVVLMVGIFCVGLVLMVLIIRLYQYKQLEENMNTWQKESRDYINVIRSQRHDFNFHVHAIVGLIENGEFEECRKYVTDVANEASLVNDIMPVHDAVVGSMLYNMRETARAKGTDIHYDITYDMEHVICNSFEINKILGNLIQNALDAMHVQEEKEAGIQVKIFKRRGNTVISVSNLFLGDKNSIVRAFELNYSTKHKHEGIGLSMILKTVEKYGGRIYTEIEDDWVRFIVNIPNYVHFEEVKHEY